MPFPFSYSKTQVFNKEQLQTDVKTSVRNILIGLQTVEASRAHNVANTIYFRGESKYLGSWNILTWDILLPISSGTILVEEKNEEIHVMYTLKFTRVLAYIAVVIPIFFGTVLITQTTWGFIEICSLIIFACLFLIGGNYLLTMLRFPRFIKNLLIQQNKQLTSH